MMADKDGVVPNHGVAIGGILAGCGAAVMVTPGKWHRLPVVMLSRVAHTHAAADVVKTRFQSPGARYSSLADCARQTWQQGGMRTMFSGALARASVQAPLYGIALLCFELQKGYLEALPSPK